MASKKDCDPKEAASGAPPATDAPPAAEGRQITGFPRVRFVEEGLFNRIHIDYNDMTGVDPSLYPDGVGLPKGVSLGEWQVAKLCAPSYFATMKSTLDLVEAAKKKANK